MNAIVIYKSKYGSTKAYAEWIAEELACSAVDAADVKANDLTVYDAIVYGGGLYAEVINGVSLITKNFELFADKKIAVFTTGLTPLDMRDYYDKMVLEKNFKPELLGKIKVYNYLGKMIIEELSLPHRAALKTLKKIMSGKKVQGETEKLLIELCDKSGDFSDRSAIGELVEYIKGNGEE